MRVQDFGIPPAGPGRVIWLLEQVIRRPRMYMMEVSPAHVQTWIWGLSMGSWALQDGGSINGRQDDILRKRGWNPECALGPVPGMREQGLSDSEIVIELLQIELEYWKRLEAEITE